MLKNVLQTGTNIIKAQIEKKGKKQETESKEETIQDNEGLNFLGDNQNEGSKNPNNELPPQETTRKKKLKEKSQKVLNAVGKQMKSKISKVRSEVNTAIRALDIKVKEALAQQKEKLNVWLRVQVEKIVLSLLAKAPPKVKAGLKDPDMPKCVKKSIDDLVDELWPDVQEEILFHLHCALDKPVYIPPEKKSPVCCLLPFYKFRSWYLYTKNPYDCSFWRQIKWISWWLLLFPALIPSYGAQAIVFLIHFLLIDKRDEFQLVKFILDFKKLHFISIGFIGSLLGYLMFFACSSVNNDYSTHEELTKCTRDGPGLSIHVYLDGIGYITHFVLVWVAYFMLGCSKAKGKITFRYYGEQSEEEISNCCCFPYARKKGGRLKVFLIYDTIIFTLSVAAFVVLIFLESDKAEWRIKAKLYFSRVIYGIFSLPFMIFILSPLGVILTKARPTGYDKHGNTVPKLKSIILKGKEVESLEDIKDDEYSKLLSSVDIGEILADDECNEETL